jgi:hypothetical protein
MKQSPLALAGSAAVLLVAGAANAQVTPEAPPVCISGGPYVTECTGPITLVPLDGTASFDPDGTPVTFFWFDECNFGAFEDPTDPLTNMIIDNTGVCVRSCNFVLRVTSGGETTPCQTSATVEDTTAPVITCPADVVEVWTNGPANGQTDPNLTGFATATDCDPSPVIAFSDVLDPGNAPGEPETIVTRTWTATDFCMHQSQCVQTITLLSPSGGGPLGAKLDVMPGVCPNQAGSSAHGGTLALTLLGTPSFDVSQVDRKTLFVQRKDNTGQKITRLHARLRDQGRPATVNSPCACGANSQDGRLDLAIAVDYAEFLQSCAITTEAPGSTVDIAVVGRLYNGSWFVVSDCAITQ